MSGTAVKAATRQRRATPDGARAGITGGRVGWDVGRRPIVIS
jgi:hypothetical protein